MDPIQGQNFFGAPPPAESPPPVAVPMSPEGVSPRRAEIPTWGDSAAPGGDFQPPVVDVPPVEQVQPAAPAQPTYEELRGQIENLNRRLADTQRGFHQEQNNSRLAQEIVNGLAGYAEQRRAHEQARDTYQPPTVQDPDALLTDPQALMRTMAEYVDYGYRRAVAEVAPYLQQAAGMAQVAPVMVENQMRNTMGEVAQAAAQEGLCSSEQEFAQLYDRATEIVMAGQIPEGEKFRLRMRPDAMLAALRIAQGSRSPRTPAPPSLGPGGGPAHRSPSAPSGYAAGIEKTLGIKFDKNDYAELGRRLHAQGGR